MAEEDNADIKDACTKDDQSPPRLVKWINVEWGPALKILLEALLTIATISLAVFTYMLWSDTHNLVLEAEKTSIRQAAEMQKSLSITKQAADATYNAAIAAQESVAVAIKANQLNRDNFIADNRPWVSVDIQIAGPLTWGKDGGGTLPLKFMLRNTGRTPALDVDVNTDIRPWAGPYLDPMSEQHRLSEQVRKQHSKTTDSNRGGWTIFPGDSLSQVIGVGFNRNVIEGVHGWYRKNFGEHTKVGPPMFIVGYVDYRLVLGGHYHQTGFILGLEHIQHNKPGLAIYPENGDVPMSELAIFYWPGFSGITD
ncbi:MAG: hypothetical protein ACLPN1_12465 [Dissulfurispiraceae bacterium]